MEEDNKQNDVTEPNAGEQKPSFKTQNRDHLTSFYKQNVVSIAVAFIAVIIVTALSVRECRKCFTTLEAIERSSQISNDNTRKYWVFGRNVESGYLDNVFSVLDKLGYENDPNTTDWDLLWAHDYPFRALYSKLNNLLSHQKINKLPGSGYITNKVDLATSKLKYIPPAFRLPKEKEQLLKYAKEYPEVQFVQKSNDHRNIFIRNIKELDLDTDRTFIQEFVDKPFLISGHKFDIGIYTIITSVDPLRIYIYNEEALLRFCPEKYYPFNVSDINKYVVGDDYLPTWEVPALKYYYGTLGFSMKESLNAYIKSQGKNPALIWDQIEDSIRTVGLAKEQQIVNVANKFFSKRNFFEMMRFDFMLTEDLKIHLMEANMSPNLSSAHFPPNRLMFEQIIFNLFSLVGIGQSLQKNTLSTGFVMDEEMLVADKNIVVFANKCNSVMCRSSCVSPICQICRQCLSQKTRTSLKQAYLEHMNKGACKRIFPPPMKQDEINLNEDLEYYSAENQLHYRWFQGKCIQDASWCT